MKEVVMFLRQLKANNNKEWFTEHKAEYQSAQAKFNAFCEELIHRIEEFDPSVRGLTLKDCTYRIYRDLRFSKDKSPYKTHMGVYVCRGGKKSGYSGYYFHVAAGNETDEIMKHFFLVRTLKKEKRPRSKNISSSSVFRSRKNGQDQETSFLRPFSEIFRKTNWLFQYQIPRAARFSSIRSIIRSHILSISFSTV